MLANRLRRRPNNIPTLVVYRALSTAVCLAESHWILVQCLRSRTSAGELPRVAARFHLYRGIDRSLRPAKWPT